MAESRRSSSRSSRTSDIPPWEKKITRGLHLTDEADAVIDMLARAFGGNRSAALDCLLRGIPLGEAVEIASERRDRDTDARAAWSRSRR